MLASERGPTLRIFGKSLVWGLILFPRPDPRTRVGTTRCANTKPVACDTGRSLDSEHAALTTAAGVARVGVRGCAYDVPQAPPDVRATPRASRRNWDEHAHHSRAAYMSIFTSNTR
jgi:hypothetical protein